MWSLSLLTYHYHWPWEETKNVCRDSLFKNRDRINDFNRSYFEQESDAEEVGARLKRYNKKIFLNNIIYLKYENISS